jgi:D-serine deaminase-like pyridoxal phosphate-dependent protein
MTLQEIPTPALVLDRSVLRRNITRMSERMRNFGVNLRPHLKTAKSVDVAKLATEGHSGAITVSTLHEAEHFARNGFNDITYAVGIAPDKLPLVSRIQALGAHVHVITDNVGVAQAIVHAASAERPYSVFIDVDTGYGRSGVLPESSELLGIGETLHATQHVTLKGMLTHAGHSYDAPDVTAITRIADDERNGAVRAAERLRAHGVDCNDVSVGSTPTMRFVERLDGVTEARPGNFVFYDLSMHGRGVCDIDDIAVSVMTEVVVNLPDRGRVLVDAGALALSQDRSADTGGMPGCGFGLVCGLDGQPHAPVVVKKTSQEQGWLGTRDDRPLETGAFPIGSRWRILPNHSCMTAAAYDRYHVVDGGNEIVAVWPRVNGWTAFD